MNHFNSVLSILIGLFSIADVWLPETQGEEQPELEANVVRAEGQGRLRLQSPRGQRRSRVISSPRLCRRYIALAF